MKLDPYSSNITDRWKKRIVYYGWDKAGKDGAKKYMERFGKNIGQDKLEALKKRAEYEGCKELAQGFQEEIDRLFGAPAKSTIPHTVTAPTSHDPYKSLFNDLWNKVDYRIFETDQTKIKILEKDGRFKDLNLGAGSKLLLPTNDCKVGNVDINTLKATEFKWDKEEKKWSVERNGYEYIIRQS